MYFYKVLKYTKYTVHNRQFILSVDYSMHSVSFRFKNRQNAQYTISIVGGTVCCSTSIDKVHCRQLTMIQSVEYG